MKFEAVISVKQINKRKSDGGAKKAVYCMKHGIPYRHLDIIGSYFAEYFCGKNKEKYYNFKCRGQLYAEIFLKKSWYKKKNQRQRTDKDIFKASSEYRKNQNRHNNHTKYQEYGKGCLMLFNLCNKRNEDAFSLAFQFNFLQSMHLIFFQEELRRGKQYPLFFP